MISLGIDIGGTGCKCVAFRDNGEQVALSYREYPTKPGEVNLDALALRESVFFVISDCVRKLEDENIVAIQTMIDSMSEEELFQPHMRRWADDATKTAVWEVYKFIHVNTVAPFGTFRTKIRKWKKAAL